MDATRGFAPPRAVRHEARLPGWEGRARIVHLTDLHVGLATPPALQRAAVALANEAMPDLVVITGDFVGRGRGFLDRLGEIVAGIEAPALAVLGNHDHWVDAGAVRGVLERAGVAVLDNAWTDLGPNLPAIVGLGDLDTGHADPRAATRGLGARPALGLAHNPESAPMLWERAVPLVLSGHTHGGQLHLGAATEVAWRGLLGVRYLSGWYEEDGGRVYVNPGVGAAVFPWRAGRPARRTVAVIDLVGEPVAAAAR